MEITSYAMLLSSPYPVELNAIKSTCEYPKDFMCPKTPLNTNICKKATQTILLEKHSLNHLPNQTKLQKFAQKLHKLKYNKLEFFSFDFV